MKPEDFVTISGVDVSLYRQKPGGNLFAYFTVGGKRHRVTTGQASARAAREEVRRLVAKAQLSMRAIKGTIREAVELMLETRWPNGTEDDRTFSDQRRRLHPFARAKGNVDLRLSREDMSHEVQKYLDSLKLSPRSIINHRRIAVMKQRYKL